MAKICYNIHTSELKMSLPEQKTGVARFYILGETAENMQNKAKKHTLKISLLTPAILLGFLTFLPFTTGALAASMSPDGIIALVNSSRKEAGLNPVVENSLLNEAAAAKAKDMLKNDYFAHTSPEGRSPWYWFKKAGYSYKYAGENLAINYTSAKEQHTAWMKSTTHRANILNAKYQEIGIAVVEGKIEGESALVTVELFGTKMIAAADKTSPVALPREETLVIPSEVKGSEGENLAIPVPPSPQPLNNFISAEKTNPFLIRDMLVERNMIVGVTFFLILSIMSAPLVLLFRTASLLREAFAGNKDESREDKADESLISVALYLAINEFLKSKNMRIHDIRGQ